MLCAYRSSDSSRQCHSVANYAADRLNGLRQSHHPQHTLHELRARLLSKIHSTVDVYSTTSDLSSDQKSRPQLEHSGGHVIVTRGHTAGETRSETGSAANAAQLRRRAEYAYTGTNSDSCKYICKYVNQRPYWIL